MAPKQTGNWIERAWRPVLERIEAGRLRRGKLSHKQGTVVSYHIQNGFYEARIKQPGYRDQNVVARMPTVDWWTKFEDEAAVWFSRRPDWLASLMRDELEQDWSDFVASKGLRLFPDVEAAERMVSMSECTCADREKPCQHVASLVHAIMADVAERPIRVLEHVGIDVPTLLDKVHAESVRTYMAKAEQDPDERTPFVRAAEQAIEYVVNETTDEIRLWDEETQVFAQKEKYGGTEKTTKLSFRKSEDLWREWFGSP